MGFFYTSITLHGAEQRDVVTYLNQIGCRAYVSSTVGLATVVFAQSAEDQGPAFWELTRELSATFTCTALAALLHDSDVFIYGLYQSGEEIDTYDSLPDYFADVLSNTGPAGGNAITLCNAFAVPEAIPAVEQILREDDDYDHDIVIDAEDRHARLVAALGLPPYAAGTGYYRVAHFKEEGEVPEPSMQRHSRHSFSRMGRRDDRGYPRTLSNVVNANREVVGLSAL